VARDELGWLDLLDGEDAWIDSLGGDQFATDQDALINRFGTTQPA
jgi:hypothetical protein